jgi:hypothetical protein
MILRYRTSWSRVGVGDGVIIYCNLCFLFEYAVHYILYID